MVDIWLRPDLDDQRAVVVHLVQLTDQLAKINDALANANLQMFFVRVAEVNIVDVREQFLEVSRAIGSVEVLAGVEAECQTFDVTADDRDCVDIA